MVGFDVPLNGVCLGIANWANPFQAFFAMHLGHVDAKVKVGICFVIAHVTQDVFELVVNIFDMLFQTNWGNKCFVAPVTRVLDVLPFVVVIQPNVLGYVLDHPMADGTLLKRFGMAFFVRTQRLLARGGELAEITLVHFAAVDILHMGMK